MVADYNSYIAEVVNEEEPEYKEEAYHSYSKAFDLAQEQLEPTDSLLLGLALNFSAFLHDVFGDEEEAVRIANQAFNEGVQGLDAIESDKDYKKSTLLMQLLRDNL